MQMRGLGVNLWTLPNISLIEQYMMQGAASLTIDGVSVLAETVREVYTDKTEYTAAVEETADVKVFGKHYARSDYEGNAVADTDLTEDAFAEPVLVDGDAFEVTADKKLRAVKEGESTVLYRYKLFSSLGEYYIYSQPITLTATAEKADTNPQEKGCGSSLTFGGIAGAGTVLFTGIILSRKKKKEN